MKFNRTTGKTILAAVLVLLVVCALRFQIASHSPQATPAIGPSANATMGNTNRQIQSSSNGTPSVSIVTNSPATILLSNANKNKASISTNNIQISAHAWKQIAALQAEKSRRTPTDQKIDSQLLYADKMWRGEPIAEGVTTVRVNLDKDEGARVLVDIKADVTDALLNTIAILGGKVINDFPQYQAIRASVPLASIEALAVRTEVIFIEPAVRAMNHAVDSEGDFTHQADTARATFGVNGTGVKVGVLSDSVDYLGSSQIAGLVTVLSGQSGTGEGEGTAMLEIIHDLAPGAQLFFATAGGSEASFANNIQQLKAAGCNIIVDDVLYFDESPFQDGIVAKAVNTVTANGALYFSSASNSGNQDSGTSGTWEGDFVDSGDVDDPALPAGSGHVHSFGSLHYDTVLTDSDSGSVLFWADPWGVSTNDYDLYVLDSTGSYVVTGSNNPQTGTQNPYEHSGPVYSGELIVLVKYSGTGRFLHLSAGDGELAISTPGSTRGHNCATNAFDVAATDANNSYPDSFTGGPANPVEDFSSDGPRRVFFHASGAPITPGNFSSTGGAVRQKPDLTAADGVTTDIPGFAPFYGTSAAAPHAAAIAALLKSAGPNLTPAQIRGILTGATLDIMSPGTDRDSGAGIVMALAAVEAAPHPDLTKRTDSLSKLNPHNGDVVTASLTITNQSCSGGGANAGAFHVGFYGLSTSSNFPGLSPFNELAINGCTANGTVTTTLNIPIDSATTPGIYYLGYRIDDKYEVPECTEGNNGINYWMVTVIPETNRPTISLTSPTSGQRWSAETSTISGTAGDNAAVANVFYSLNGLSWTGATTANHWSNWTAQAALTPGTNKAFACSVDTSGNFSITSSVSFQYVVTNQLGLQKVGLGTFSPTNQLLELGRNYSILATPATGFIFTNWMKSTNWIGGVQTNNATVQFMMSPNLTLQATFADISKPTLAITNLTAGQRINTEGFTVKGTAGDNWLVSNVVCQINGGGWISATNINLWTNWAAGVTLVPGTNLVQACAVDTTGNTSMTNSVSFQYVVTNQLGLQKVGLGTFSPTNQLLELGRNYSIVATPATGFVFTNWMISTNWIGGVQTNSPTMQFMMVSNLTLQATFADVTKPTLSISAPTAGQHLTNALATVVGTTADNWKVSGVWYQLNGNAWNLVTTTTNSYTNWAQTVTLLAGTNTLKAYALDPGGNYSTTGSVSVISSNTFQLLLKFTAPQPLTSTGLNFGLQLSPGLNGRIQTSTNLADWVTLTNFVGTNSMLNFRDPGATNLNRRFYRAVVP